MSTRFSKAVAAEIVESVFAGCSVADAAREAGVPAETVRHWLKRGRSEPRGIYGEFAEEVARARITGAQREMTAEEFSAYLARAIRAGSVQAMRLWRDIEEERRRSEHEPDQLDDLKRRRQERLATRGGHVAGRRRRA